MHIRCSKLKNVLFNTFVGTRFETLPAMRAAILICLPPKKVDGTGLTIYQHQHQHQHSTNDQLRFPLSTAKCFVNSQNKFGTSSPISGIFSIFLVLKKRTSTFLTARHFSFCCQSIFGQSLSVSIEKYILQCALFLGARHGVVIIDKRLASP